MKYTYVTATGKIEIEVNERLHNVLIALDKEEYNSNRKHNRRRPISLSSADFDGDWMASGIEILEDLIRLEDREQRHPMTCQGNRNVPITRARASRACG